MQSLVVSFGTRRCVSGESRPEGLLGREYHSREAPRPRGCKGKVSQMRTCGFKTELERARLFSKVWSLNFVIVVGITCLIV